MSDDETYERGMQTRREVMSDEYVDGALQGKAPVASDFQRFITEHAWGDVWSRPGLDRRMRSAVTVALLTALGRDHELEAHLLAARRNGLSEEEIGEVLLHTGVYAGVPAANSAFALAERVFDDHSEV